MFGQRRKETNQSQSNAANTRRGGADTESGLVLFLNNEGEWATQSSA